LLTGLSTAIATRRGVTELTTGHPILDGMIAALGAFVITAVIAVFLRILKVAPALFFGEQNRADHLTLQIRPKLKISFDPDRGCLVDSPVQEWFEQADTHKLALAWEYRTIYARIRVDAISKVKVRGCSAFLTEIETKQGDEVCKAFDSRPRCFGSRKFFGNRYRSESSSFLGFYKNQQATQLISRIPRANVADISRRL
jgi:hypothetical protein